MYELTVECADVSEWDNFGEGEEIGSKGVHMTMPLPSLTRKAIVEALNDNFGVILSEASLTLRGNIGTFPVIEDDDANQTNIFSDDDEPRFLSLYSFTITPVYEPIDLSLVQ